MARARNIIADSNSAELDELRRMFNNLLHMIEGAEASLAATATAEAVLQAWADGVRDGVDSNPDSETNVVGTNVEIHGIRPNPLHPKRHVQAGTVVEMALGSDY